MDAQHYDTVLLTFIIAFFALVYGWFFSLGDALRPTLGDILIGTLKSSAIPAILLIIVIWMLRF